MEQGWERPPRVDLRHDELSYLVAPVFSGGEVAEFAVLGTGLANTNIRFRMRGGEATYVLRLHTRDAGAAVREASLMAHFAKRSSPAVPVAPLLYSDPGPSRGAHPYSIWGFVEGTLLEALFTTLSSEALAQIGHACGGVLAAISSHTFARCGELGRGLEIVEEYGAPSEFVPKAVHSALFEGRAGERLGAELRDALWRTVERASPSLVAIDGHSTLVHADYKRSNLLMSRSSAAWRVSAVLDWEFACAGPPLIDVGIFLRAGEGLPRGFREAFVSGYEAGGGELPADWLPLSRLLDVISQVTFLNDPRERPRVFAESIDVLRETMRLLA